MKRPAFTAKQRLDTFKAYGAIVLCQADGCDSAIYISEAELDHHVALIDGGKHELDNWRPVCSSCHRRKSAHERMMRMAEDTIARAFRDAEMRRPYKLDHEIIRSATPPGGDWKAVAEPGAITRSVVWGRTEVAIVNPRGDLSDSVEGQITMAVRALPVLDAAMRSIIVLAEDASNVELIRALAISVIAHVELSAPEIPEEDEEETAAPRGPGGAHDAS